jgi:hypothetical protein
MSSASAAHRDEELALYRALRETYVRLHDAIRRQRYEDLGETLERTHDLFARLEQAGQADARARASATALCGHDAAGSEKLSLLTEILSLRERVLEAAGSAAAETRAALVRLGRGRAAVRHYRGSARVSPRLHSQRI